METSIDRITLKIEMDGILSELLALLASIDEERLNEVPFEGSWTAAQLAKHLLLSYESFIGLINGPVEDTVRNPLQMADVLSSVFLDFTTKLESPAFITPPLLIYNKNEMMSNLGNCNNSLDYILENLDLSKTCLLFQLPNLGSLTRAEALHFIIVHTTRHCRQLQHIRESLQIISA